MCSKSIEIMMNILRLRGFCLDLAQMLDFGAHPINKPLLDDRFPCFENSSDFFRVNLYVI